MEKNVKDKTKVTIYETNIARGQFPKKNSSKNGILKVNGKMNGPNWIVEIKDNIHAKIVQHSLINPLEKPSIIEIAIITKLMISTILLLNSIQVPALDKFNNRIYSPEVQVISSDGENLGVLNTTQAISMAKNERLDLIEISPNAKPPVCKIMDMGKYKYDAQKKSQ